MSEVKRINSKCLLELELVFDPGAAESHHISWQFFVQIEAQFKVSSTNQKAVQSKWTIIHLAGLKTKEWANSMPSKDQRSSGHR